MRRLVGSNLRKAIAHPGREAGLLEGGGIELVKGSLVEVVLKVLEGQSVLEDGSVCEAQLVTVTLAPLLEVDRPSTVARVETAGAAYTEPARARTRVARIDMLMA
jgi:hypothetical protein